MSATRALNEAERVFAAEHALGVTEGDARAEAEARLARDPAFREAVEAWHVELEPMLDDVEPRRPPARLRRAVLNAIDPDETSLRPPVVLGPWRALVLMGLGGALTVMVLAALPFDTLGSLRTLMDRTVSEPQPLVASLGPGDMPNVLARTDPATGRLSLRVDLSPERTART